MLVVVAHPFTGVVPARCDFTLVCDVGGTAYFPGARAVVDGRVGIVVDLREDTTGEVVLDLRDLGVREHVSAAAEASDPEGLVVSFDDEDPEVGSP
jgi:hypothetical protein